MLSTRHQRHVPLYGKLKERTKSVWRCEGPKITVAEGIGEAAARPSLQSPFQSLRVFSEILNKSQDEQRPNEFETVERLRIGRVPS